MHAGAEREGATCRKAKRRRACAECYRLREKCVYEDLRDDGTASDTTDDDNAPCQRCKKLGKLCEPRNASAATERRAGGKLKRERPNACAECRRARGKCVWTKSGACERCLSLGKHCLPYIEVRRTAQDHAAFEDELTRVCASMRQLCSFETSDDLASTRKAAADMSLLINELRLDAVPRIILGILRYMFLVARETGSLARLHKTTSMAAALGAVATGDVLDGDMSPLSQGHEDSLTARAVERFRLNEPMTAAFYLISNVGKRKVHSNKAYGLFVTQESLEEQVRAGNSPVLESWAAYMVDKEEASKAVDKSMADLMTCSTSVNTEYGLVHYASTTEHTLEAVDLAGARFEAVANLNVAVQEDGRYFFGSVRLKQLKPLDKLATSRLVSLLSPATVPDPG